MENEEDKMSPPVEPRPPPERTRAEPVMPKPSQRTRRGRAEGCTEERLSWRPAARSVVYRRAFEGGAGTGGGSMKIEEEATGGAPAEVEGGEGGVGQAQAEEGAGGGRRAAWRRGFRGGPWSETWSTGGAFEDRAFSTRSCGGRGVFGVPLPSRTRARVARDLGVICA
ncbi:unnamed protein product [Ectocarpus sp. 4 AP-2014]